MAVLVSPGSETYPEPVAMGTLVGLLSSVSRRSWCTQLPMRAMSKDVNDVSPICGR